MHQAGAEIAMTYLNDKARPYVEPLAPAVEASLLLPLEVRTRAQVDALFEAIAAKWGRLDILVHSIAFAPREALAGRVTDCPRDGFLTAMDVSCWSFLDLTRRAEKLMTGGRHDLRDELSRRQRGHRELRHHGPGQGRARIGGALPGGRARAQAAFASTRSAPARWRPARPLESPISMR